MNLPPRAGNVKLGRALLSAGNSKTGRIHSFSLLPRITCPGATPTCLKECYGMSGRFYAPKIKQSMAYNTQLAQHDPDQLENRLQWEMAFRNVRLLRIHVVGDFFAGWYAALWCRIAHNFPDVGFYFYTRSWLARDSELRDNIAALAAKPNVQGWLSCDRDTGWPNPGYLARYGPRTFKTCYLATHHNEIVPLSADLVFRPRRIRHVKAKRMGLTLVCPQEQQNHSPGELTTCLECRVCLPEPTTEGQ